MYLVAVLFRTHFRMNFTDKEKEKICIMFIFLYLTKSRTLHFYCEYLQKNRELTGSNDVQHLSKIFPEFGKFVPVIWQ